MPKPYYDYTKNPVVKNDPNALAHWESVADWPKGFNYISNTGIQGLHPPAPVYQTNQPAQTSMYYYEGNPTSAAGYYLKGAYYGPTAPSAPVAAPATPFAFPVAAPAAPPPWYSATVPQFYGATASPYAATAQAATMVAANAALAQMPSAPYYFPGASALEIQAQNAIIAAQFGQPAAPNQLVPFKPGATPQFWCKELDGSWTLRELNDFTSGDLAAGRWEVHPTSGYRYFVKQVT